MPLRAPNARSETEFHAVDSVYFILPTNTRAHAAIRFQADLREDQGAPDQETCDNCPQ
jgi:hypothetical protein